MALHFFFVLQFAVVSSIFSRTEFSSRWTWTHFILGRLLWLSITILLILVHTLIRDLGHAPLQIVVTTIISLPVVTVFFNCYNWWRLYNRRC